MAACYKNELGKSVLGQKGPFWRGGEKRKFNKKEIGKKKLLCKRCRKEGKKKKLKRNPWGIVEEKKERRHARRAKARAREQEAPN